METCPQYLVLDDSVYYNDDWLQAAKYVCSPPIRKPADREALWPVLVIIHAVVQYQILGARLHKDLLAPPAGVGDLVQMCIRDRVIPSRI